MSAESSRRETLRDAAMIAGAIAAVPLIPALVRPDLARAQGTDDEAVRDFLVPAIEFEQLAVLAYSTAIDANDLDGLERRTLEQLRSQDQAHANAFRSALDALGFDLPDAPDSTTDAEAFDDVEGLDDPAASELTDLLGDLDAARRGEELLEVLVALKERAISYYRDSAPGLDSEDLTTTSAEIAGSHAQQLVVLREAGGQSPAGASDVGSLGDASGQ